MDGAEIVKWQHLIRQVIIAPHVQDYIVRLTMATHPQGAVRHADHQPIPPLGRQPPRRPDRHARRQGASAARSGRYNVSFEDVRRVYIPAMRHRVILNFEAQAEGIDTDHVLTEILKQVPKRVTRRSRPRRPLFPPPPRSEYQPLSGPIPRQDGSGLPCSLLGNSVVSPPVRSPVRAPSTQALLRCTADAAHPANGAQTRDTHRLDQASSTTSCKATPHTPSLPPGDSIASPTSSARRRNPASSRPNHERALDRILPDAKRLRLRRLWLWLQLGEEHGLGVAMHRNRVLVTLAENAAFRPDLQTRRCQRRVHRGNKARGALAARYGRCSADTPCPPGD